MAPISELIRLYRDEQLTLQEIGDRFGVSRQAIHDRLAKTGIKMRPKARREKPLGADLQEAISLYQKERLSLAKVATRLGVSEELLTRDFDRAGIQRWRNGETMRKYPELRELRIGESLELPRLPGANPFQRYYDMARRVGIRVSCRTLDEDTMRVTRTA